MRRFVEIVAAMLALSASAFDSEAWMAKRDMQKLEALRLRQAYRKLSREVTTPATDVSVPFDTFEDGSIKTSVFAKQAQYFMNSGFVWASGVVVKKFKRDGSVDAVIEAQNCLIDRFTKSGWADGPAKLTQGKTVIDGEDVYFSSIAGFVRANRRSRIVTQDLKTGGLRP